MIKPCKRGGSRNTLSDLPEGVFKLEVTDHVLPLVEDILARGLRWVTDRVSFYSTENAESTDFYPIDKTLTQQELEDINLYLIGCLDVCDTKLKILAEVIANNILHSINKELDNGAEHVILTFARSTEAEKTGRVPPVFAMLRRKGSKVILETETSYSIDSTYKLQ